MTAAIIDGKAAAQRLRDRVGAEVARLQYEYKLQPGLAVVLVGEDPASQVYVRNKGKQTVEAGMLSQEHKLDDNNNRGAGQLYPDQLWHPAGCRKAKSVVKPANFGEERFDRGCG